MAGNGHHDAIVGIFSHPDGERLVTVAQDRNICVWNRNSGELIQSFFSNQGPTPEAGDLYAADLSKNGKVLAVAGKGLGKKEALSNSIRLIDLEAQRTIGLMKGKGTNQHTASIYQLTFSPQEDQLLSIDRSGNVLAWTAETSGPTEFGYLSASTSEAKFKPKSIGGKFKKNPWSKVYAVKDVPELEAAVLATDQGLYAYQWEEKEIIQLSPKAENVPSFAVRTDSVIIYSTLEGNLWAWKKTAYDLKAQQLIQLPYPPYLINFNPKGDQYFISNGMRCDNLIVETLSGEVLTRLEPMFHQDLISTCTFLGDYLLAVGDFAGRIGIWDSRSGTLVRQLGGPTFPIRTVSWEGNGSIRFGACFGKDNVDLCAPKPWKKEFPIHPTPFEFSLEKLSLQLVNGQPTRKGGSPEAAGFKIKSRAEKVELEVSFLPEQAIAVYPDNLFLGAPLASKQEEVFVPNSSGFEVYSTSRKTKGGIKTLFGLGKSPGQGMPVFEGQHSKVYSIAESPERGALVTAGQDRIIRIWDQVSLELVASLYFDQEANWICWTPDLYYCTGTLVGFETKPRELKKWVQQVNHQKEDQLPQVKTLAELPEERNNSTLIQERLKSYR